MRLRNTGEPSLRERLVEKHLQIVPAIVRKFRGKAEWDDLIQVGYLGLLKAVDGFNPVLDTRFSTYATHCIFGELRHYVRDRIDVVRRPRWLASLSKQVAGYIEIFLHDHHRLPTFNEIADGLNLSREGVEEILRAKMPISLDDQEGESPIGLHVEKIRSRQYETFRLPMEDRIVLQQAVERLVELEKRIIYLFFYRDLTQGQIAGEMGLPPKKVSRLMRKALDRLRGLMGFGGAAPPSEFPAEG